MLRFICYLVIVIANSLSEGYAGNIVSGDTVMAERWEARNPGVKQWPASPVNYCCYTHQKTNVQRK